MNAAFTPYKGLADTASAVTEVHERLCDTTGTTGSATGTTATLSCALTPLAITNAVHEARNNPERPPNHRNHRFVSRHPRRQQGSHHLSS
jgi:hypothetical protein